MTKTFNTFYALMALATAVSDHGMIQHYHLTSAKERQFMSAQHTIRALIWPVALATDFDTTMRGIQE